MQPTARLPIKYRFFVYSAAQTLLLIVSHISLLAGETPVPHRTGTRPLPWTVQYRI